jgi:hypothetical protein
MILKNRLALLVSVGLLLPAGVQAVQLDAPQLAYDGYGHLDVTAGQSGAPSGVSVWWMDYADFVALGGQWFEEGHALQHEATFAGALSANQLDRMGVTDVFAASGIPVNLNLRGSALVFRAHANEGGGYERSAATESYVALVADRDDDDCDSDNDSDSDSDSDDHNNLRSDDSDSDTDTDSDHDTDTDTDTDSDCPVAIDASSWTLIKAGFR